MTDDCSSMSSTCCGIFLFKCSRGAGRCYLTTWKAAGTRRTFRNISSSALSSGGLTSTVTTKKQMLPEISCFVFFFYRHIFTSMISVRDVVYNKATDDFTVSVKDLKRDIVMDGERLVIVTPTPSQPRRRRPPPLSPGSTTWWSPPATTRCPTCPPSPASRSSPAGFFMHTTSGFLRWDFS